MSYGLSGCSKSIPLDIRKLPIPTKDVVASVNGEPFTLADFLMIRNQLRQPSNSKTYWLGISSLAILKAPTSQGKSLTLQDAYQISRYAIGELTRLEVQSELKLLFDQEKELPSPEVVKVRIDQMVAQSWIQPGLVSLSQIQ